MVNIKCNVKKSIEIIVIGIFLISICGFLAFVDFRSLVDRSIFNNDVIYYFVKGLMIFGLVFFGFGLLILIRNVIFFTNRLIEIKEDYMIDRSSYISIGKIYYKDIDSIYIKGMFLCIKLKNEQEVLRKVNLLKKLFIIANKKMKYEYITISDNFLDTDIYKIKTLILENKNK
jgi:hypothetical protein